MSAGLGQWFLAFFDSQISKTAAGAISASRCKVKIIEYQVKSAKCNLPILRLVSEDIKCYFSSVTVLVVLSVKK
jgi:hypothetical protein